MIKLVISAALIIAGLFMFLTATLGVNRFRQTLSRIHAAALGDTLGLLFVILGLVVYQGMRFSSLKLLAVVVFFWLASPVAGHMIARLERETDEEVQELEVEER